MTAQEHVRVAVAQHRWSDLSDWAAALAELTQLSDAEIEAIATDAQKGLAA
ncbi:MAG: hypothetical protein IPK79_01095 [Vampirovibrionales bacterium]|nr:hypothetical protein [Vampirovibrionales bacterium]MBK8200647.1 hypothetical protein [Acidobacteriota bacterium]